MPVLMELSRIFIREMEDIQIIELTEVDGSRTFPIVIGLPEAIAIERRLKGEKIPRPQTHDLLASVMRTMGGVLREVHIHDLRDGTFFAKLLIEHNGSTIEVDSRPSDAIALVVAEGAPIYVAEHVLESAVSEGDESAQPKFEFDEDEDEDEPEESW